MQSVAIQPSISQDRFAAYGAIIDRPAQFGERAFYSRWLGGEGLAPVFHVNKVPATVVPAVIDRLERHPHAAQCFVPLDVSRYLVTVAPSLADGTPDLDQVETFIVPGTLGVIYAPGVWHAGISVIDREGAFAVLMWRGANDDDVFTEISPLQLVSEEVQA